MAEEDSSVGVTDAATAATALGELIRAAGDSREAKQAGAELGKAMVTVTKALNNVLLPLAALNNGFDRAKFYFEKRFGEDVSEVTKQIPPEALIEPKLSIAGPVVQNLAFALEDPPLKDMYLELLGKAMDERQHGTTHPAFVEIIRQLTSEEAIELKVILQINQFAIVNIREKKPEGGSAHVYRHLLDWHAPDKQQAEHPILPMMVVNWIRLGLIEVTYERQFSDDSLYNWVESRPEFVKIKNELASDSVTIEKGILSITPFGNQFAVSTGLRPPPQARTVETSPPPPPANH